MFLNLTQDHQLVQMETIAVTTDRKDVTSIMPHLQSSRKATPKDLLLLTSGSKCQPGGKLITRYTGNSSHMDTSHKGPGPGELPEMSPPPGVNMLTTVSRADSVY